VPLIGALEESELVNWCWSSHNCNFRKKK